MMQVGYRWGGSMDQEDALIGAVAAGRYSFKRCIAQGRMARVYECTHGVLSTRCVIKVMRPDWVGDDEARRGFLNEAKHLARVRHPAVVRISELTSLDGSPSSNPLMIVLERLEGVTVEELLWDGPLPLDWATLITTEVARCLHAAHLLGIVHGGLRASEVFLTGVRRMRPLEGPLPGGSVKVLDWGDSRDLAGQPELTAARAADQRAVGRLFTQLLTGLTGKFASAEQAPPAWMQRVPRRAT
jgi:serine/threonine protein kinase